MTDTLEGLVIARAHGYFVVRTDDGVARLCTLRGKLRRARQLALRPAASVPAKVRSTPRQAPPVSPESPAETPVIVAVGDRVRLVADGAAGGTIESILPRRTKLARAAVESHEEQILLANLDLAVLVFAVREPSPHLGLLDRYLVLAEDAEITALIVFNKIDLDLPEEVAEAIELYESLGYAVVTTSIVGNTGIAELTAALAGKVALLTGPSGVGKSSLLNIIEPHAAQRVGEISDSTGKGRHTTTGVQLFPLSDGGWIADSAGIRELAPWGLPRAHLAEAFVEFRPFLGHCEFEDCTHSEDETGCAIHAAVDDGQIAESRFESYLRLYEDAED